MPISNAERNLRFSNFTLEEYNVLKNHYNTKLLSLMESDNNFKAILESKKSYIKAEKKLEREATELLKSEYTEVVDFAKAVLKFLTSPVRFLNGFLGAVSGILAAGGVVLSIVITLLIGVLLFAVTVIPFGLLSAGLFKINKSMKDLLATSKDKNIKKYKKVSENIINQKDGVKDIRVLDKVITIGEALDEVKSHPEMIPVGEARSMYNLLTITESKIEEINSGKYEKKSVKESMVPVEEKMILNDKDIYYNKDKFDSGEINLCFNISVDASSPYLFKTLTSNRGSNDKSGPYPCNLSWLVCIKDSMSLESLKKFNDAYYSFFSGRGKKYYVSKEDLYKLPESKVDEYANNLIPDFIHFLMSYAKAHKSMQFIVIGAHMVNKDLNGKYYINPKELEDYAVYIKGTSLALSKYRNDKESVNNSYSDASRLTRKLLTFKTFKNLSWESYKELEKNVNRFRQHFSKLESVKESFEYSKNDLFSMRLDVLENLAPEDLTYSSISSIMESSNIENDTEMFVTLESVVSKPLLSGSGLLHGIASIATEVCDRTTILKFLNTYKDTVKYELTHESYNDLPILKATGVCLEYVRYNCFDLPEVMESCDQLDQLLGDIITECETSVEEEGFNPNPFGLGSLTPFPVASRTVGEIICDVCDAETDDEITEAMLSFGRVSNIINESYYVNTLEDGSSMIIEASSAGKVARKVETKANEKFSKSAAKDKTAGVKAAVKHTVDPMEKFIQDQYRKLKQKDANERRNVIMKGGTVPKITRWIKRGIGLIGGVAVGQLIPAAAIISGITFLGFIATDKYLDRKERAKIMRELEDEIQICNEKIDDSRGDDNKQKKYELMRIRNSLERQRDKIRFNLSD